MDQDAVSALPRLRSGWIRLFLQARPFLAGSRRLLRPEPPVDVNRTSCCRCFPCLTYEHDPSRKFLLRLHPCLSPENLVVAWNGFLEARSTQIRSSPLLPAALTCRSRCCPVVDFGRRRPRLCTCACARHEEDERLNRPASLAPLVRPRCSKAPQSACPASSHRTGLGPAR